MRTSDVAPLGRDLAVTHPAVGGRRALPTLLCAALLAGGGCGLVSPVPPEEYTTGITYYDLLTLTTLEHRIDRRIVKAIRARGKAEFRKARLKVYAHNGVVLLLGTLPTAEDIDRFSVLAGEIENVRRVHNFIQRAGTLRPGLDTADNWTSLQARLALGNLPDSLQARTKLTVHNGVVYVMGIIREREKRSLHSAMSELGQIRKLVLLTETID